MFKKIVVPISGDAITKKELNKLAKLAKIDNAEVVLVYIPKVSITHWYQRRLIKKRVRSLQKNYVQKLRLN